MLIYTIQIALVTVLVTTSEGRKSVGVFWGANLAHKHGPGERPLRDYCAQNTYDIIILSTLTRNGATGNVDDLPSLNFANHCNDNKVAGLNGYYSYKKCPSLEGQIKYCQTKNVKVLLDVGSGVYHVGFSSPDDAKKFAKQLWNVFLGGSYKLRTFGSAVLDGVNLSLRKSDSLYMVEFVTEMRRILDENATTDRKFLLTASPSCFLPNPILGTALKEATSAFDYLYINFADQFCDINKGEKYMGALTTWLTYAFKGPKIYMGLPARKDAQYYGDRKLVKRIAKEIFGIYKKFVEGIMLYEASWDDLNTVDGKRYSQFIREVFDGKDPAIVSGNPGTTSTVDNRGHRQRPNKGQEPTNPNHNPSKVILSSSVRTRLDTILFVTTMSVFLLTKVLLL